MSKLSFVCFGSFLILIFSCNISDNLNETKLIEENNFDSLSLNSYVENDFPFFSTYLDARELGRNFPDNNVVSRGLVVNLGDSSYACFDRDLLRWSVAWTGDLLTESMLPQVSYSDYFNKENTVPLVAGKADIATGVYPGWSAGQLVLEDIRSENQFREGFAWGPLPSDYGRWNGCYPYGDRVVLSYSIANANVLELPGSVKKNGETIYTRTIEVDAFSDTLFINAAEIRNGTNSYIEDGTGYIYVGKAQDSLIAVGIGGSSLESGPKVRISDGKYISVVIPPGDQKRKIAIFLWKGWPEDIESFHSAISDFKIEMPNFGKGGEPNWPERVLTKGMMASDTSTFVTDLVTLPLPNPWNRNVRVTDLTFLSKEKAAVSTFEGDIWLVDGIKGDLEKMSWKRFASGLYEPMSIEYFRGQIYTFGKEGIVRLHDINGDNEADFYENFCDLMQQSAESYEWASDMVMSEKYGIFISKGGGLTARPGITKVMTPGFRAGSNHSGVIMKVSLDGKKVDVFSTGFRAPYMGFHPDSGILTATDQQGNYVPSTPIYSVGEGGFYGVPATSHRGDHPVVKRPITWIPHRIDRSAGSQIWITSGQMGPLNNSLVHFSFGRPGLFKVLLHSTENGIQGAVVPIHSEYSTPVIKGEMGPGDGQLYMAGFNLFGSSSEGISAIQRLRYTRMKNYIPNKFRVGEQGVILSFDTKLDSNVAIDPKSYKVKRWNYQRSEKYGSGHFKLDDTPGEEILPVLSSYISTDQKKVLLLIPDMKVVDQMELLYHLKAKDGQELNDGVWFSVNHVEDLDLQSQDFKNVNLDKLQIDTERITSLIKSDPPITRERGRDLFREKGCESCHSSGTKTDGMYGPPFKGIYGSERAMADGSFVIADDDYLKESILEPEKKIVKGYEAEMPSFQGILSDADIEALLLYIMYLKY
ncbi:DUF6797 domain-containing protein [Membranihabitans maritimus]|uniref:DUF6797 domain-containing protein n=1 Tax=Membranihabitans maritimus TaxID=2904244 RepID=UPI001F030A19|nr:DUF6797 domain-containing protein [Membranihabitans maritimus]